MEKEQNNNFICNICQKSYRSKVCLRVHIKHKHPSESSPLRFQCDECGKIFKWKDTLKDHLILKHQHSEPGTKLLWCHFCSKKFLHKTQLEYHLPKHNDFRPYQCQKCGKRFKYKHSWKKHNITVHSDKREFQCDTCGKTFKTKNYLCTHEINVHQQNIPFKCRFCEKSLKTKKILNYHIQQVHQKKERKFICSICFEAFVSPKDLLRHSKIHSKIKDFQCDHCHKSFSRADNLQSHQKTHKNK